MWLVQYPLIYCVLFLCPFLLWGQQIPDTLFPATVTSPAYQKAQGPKVYIDGGHGNFHTADNRFAPFAKLLERDGYQILSGSKEIELTWLQNISILVIANALHESNQDLWSLPTPSAFNNEEITIIEQWVNKGGSLLLIADHMPFPGATEELAAKFGFKFTNGFAMNEIKQWPPSVFRMKDSTLKAHNPTWINGKCQNRLSSYLYRTSIPHSGKSGKLTGIRR